MKKIRQARAELEAEARQKAADAKADPDSRIMPDGVHKGSFVQAYNAQIAVDSEAQIIVAANITQQSNDKQQLAPMLEQVKQNTGASPVACSADTGYWSPEQVTDKRVEGIDLHVATGRDKHGASAAVQRQSKFLLVLPQLKMLPKSSRLPH